MKIRSFFSTGIFLLSSALAFSQTDTTEVANPVIQDTIVEEQDYKPYNALAPAKAAFFSAILPGLGQAYNGRYWKIPIAYGGLGVGVYFYINNTNEYQRYRSAYKDRLAGRTDEFEGRISMDGLIRGQEFYQRNQEISALVIAGIYLLNIIDANVDAHLQQFNVNEDLSFKPKMNFDEFTGKTRYGLSLNYRF